ncbi:MAG: glutathione peroxidase [Pseudomonadaceae bacterium]|nr:glutathione peroxidase [Pseudomonadaceae bacterium]
MNPKKIGDRIPSVSFRTRTANGWQDVTTDQVFAGRTVVLFSLPGAFTPTCSGSQVPGYNALAPVFKANGVDEIVCMSVNDAFVMNEWQRSQAAWNLTFLPDGNGEFTDGMGLLVDKGDLGFGKRSWRYSMLVRDGVIEALFAEPNVPGDPYEVSDPETMLAQINPNATLPDAVTVISREGCPHCVRAKDALQRAGLEFEEVSLAGALTNRSLLALTGASTTPQVFVNGELVGSADDLETYLAARKAA